MSRIPRFLRQLARIIGKTLEVLFVTVCLGTLLIQAEMVGPIILFILIMTVAIIVSLGIQKFAEWMERRTRRSPKDNKPSPE